MNTLEAIDAEIYREYNVVKHYCKIMGLLRNKLPDDLIIMVVFDYGILTDEQKFKFITDRLRAYNIKGDKRKFGKFIRTLIKSFMMGKLNKHNLWETKSWYYYGLTYLVKAPHTTGVSYQGHPQRIEGKWNRIQDIIDRICNTGNTDLLRALIIIEKYLLENKFIR